MIAPLGGVDQTPARPEFTDEQIIRAVGDAIRGGDFAAVTGLIHLLALQNPGLAQDLLDTLKFGVDLTKELSRG